jgi:hypothetical protein
MSADPLNANPTILSASDLPTRRRRRPSSHANIDTFSALFSNGIALSGDLSDPFAASPVSLSDSDSENDAIVDRIDEQEIYGTLLASANFATTSFVLCSRRVDASVVTVHRGGLLFWSLLLRGEYFVLPHVAWGYLFACVRYPQAAVPPQCCGISAAVVPSCPVALAYWSPHRSHFLHL